MSILANILLSDVAKHNKEGDVWIVLNGDIWDVTGFAAKHPGGKQIIQEHFGRDGSEAYNEIHGPGLALKYLGESRRVGKVDGADRPSASSGEHIAEGQQAAAKPPLDAIVSIAQFEPISKTLLKPKAWGYIYGATEDGFTHKANALSYQRISFRPRALIGVSKVDTRIVFLGQRYAMPIFNAPTSSVKLAHRDGELALVRAGAAYGVAPIIPAMSSYSLAEIVEAMLPNQPFFFQLYVNKDREETARTLREVRDFGAKAIMVTVDLPVLSKRESGAEPSLSAASGNSSSNAAERELAPAPVNTVIDPALQWDDIAWIRETSGLPIFLKGIQCAADARRAVDIGCAGIYLSNHGGRALDTAPPAIMTLLEIQANCPEILSQVEVVVDGGVKRGSDVLKAICLGASAVCLGRPLLYALAAYGEEGVKHALGILKAELEISMQLLGITSLDQAHPGLLNTSELDALIYKGDDHPYAKRIVRSTQRESKL